MLVKSEKALQACRTCLDAIVSRGKACAFRSLGNEYCEGIEKIEREEMQKRDIYEKATRGEN